MDFENTEARRFPLLHPSLTRLQPVPLRDAWPHEAGSFTPWLAQCENLQLLGETVGMALECEAQEQAVGDFSADSLSAS